MTDRRSLSRFLIRLACETLPPEAWSVPVPGVLPLLLAMLGFLRRALQLVITAPAPGRGETTG